MQKQSQLWPKLQEVAGKNAAIPIKFEIDYLQGRIVFGAQY